MIRRCLELLALEAEGGTRRILCSPAVGVYSGAPRPGEGLIEGSFGGTLVILGRTVDLVIPRGTRGMVVGVPAARGSFPVAYGEALFELDPAPEGTSPGRASGTATVSSGASGAATHRRGTSGSSSPLASLLPEGLFALRAPTTGIFYGRPDPASPPFVSAGSQLSQGQTAGLIEVMKSFSPIVHPGGELPSPALVVEVRSAEGAEVEHGQILFLLRAV